jgi:hypothetical protein
MPLCLCSFRFQFLSRLMMILSVSFRVTRIQPQTVENKEMKSSRYIVVMEMFPARIQSANRLKMKGAVRSPKGNNARSRYHRKLPSNRSLGGKASRISRFALTIVQPGLEDIGYDVIKRK